jgi:hypothetical protein
MRWFTILLCVVLGGCSIPMDDIAGPTRYVPPGAPSASAKIEGLKKAIVEEKLKGKVEFSSVRISDRGWGRYMVCLKGSRDNQGSGYYSVFFDNNDYKGVRESVIYDFCVQQAYRPMA